MEYRDVLRSQLEALIGQTVTLRANHPCFQVQLTRRLERVEGPGQEGAGGAERLVLHFEGGDRLLVLAACLRRTPERAGSVVLALKVSDLARRFGGEIRIQPVADGAVGVGPDA